MKKHRHGFTLAEVLITLVIIGVIAAMTIPTLMNKTNEQETVVAVKKAYSTLSQAYQRIVADYGEITPSSLHASSADEFTKSIATMFEKYLNVQKSCGMEEAGDCWSTANGGMYKTFNGSDWLVWNSPQNEFYRMTLSDGVSLGIVRYYFGDGNGGTIFDTYGLVYVDVNGHKGPNTAGKDVFLFYLRKHDVLPLGTPDDPTYTLSTCRTSGAGCAACVITKGNMDYLKKDVSW